MPRTIPYSLNVDMNSLSKVMLVTARWARNIITERAELFSYLIQGVGALSRRLALESL